MFMSKINGLIKSLAEDAENDMIDMAFEPKNSRLSCQIIVSDELDGLEVTTPKNKLNEKNRYYNYWCWSCGSLQFINLASKDLSQL